MQTAVRPAAVLSIRRRGSLAGTPAGEPEPRHGDGGEGICEQHGRHERARRRVECPEPPQSGDREADRQGGDLRRALLLGRPLPQRPLFLLAGAARRGPLVCGGEVPQLLEALGGAHAAVCSGGHAPHVCGPRARRTHRRTRAPPAPPRRRSAAPRGCHPVACEGAPSTGVCNCLPSTDRGDGSRYGRSHGELLYEEMDPDQAADALDEFIAERGAALEHLRSVLAAEGLDPHTTLDHTVESVARVWETITARAARLGVNPRSLEDDPTRPSWPSWARHGMLVDPHPPAATLALVDGFTSCLSRLFTSAVPGAAWIVGEHRIADHPMRDHPVLATGHHMVFVPPFPLYSAYQSAHGRPPAGRGRDDRPAARPRRGRVGPPLRTGCPGGDCPVLGRDEAEAVVRLVAGATPAAMNRHRLVAATAIVVAVLAAVRSGTRRPRQRVERTTARA